MIGRSSFPLPIAEQYCLNGSLTVLHKKAATCTVQLLQTPVFSLLKLTLFNRSFLKFLLAGLHLTPLKDFLHSFVQCIAGDFAAVEKQNIPI